MSEGDERALLAAIIAQPEEDTPRLIYADWLDEHGQPARAEFIRVQIAIARIRSEAARRIAAQQSLGRTNKGGTRLTIRERRLWDRGLWKDVAFKLPFATPDRRPHLEDVRRGFPERLACTAADWLAHGDAIRARHPVTRVRLTTELDYYRPGDDRVRLAAGADVERDCIRAKWGCWWTEAAGPGTVLDRILRTEWPGITFEVPA